MLMLKSLVHGSTVGVKLRRFGNGVRFRYVVYCSA